MRVLCWLRRDLRLADHAPLAHSTRLGETAVAFVFDRNILDALADRDDRRVSLIHRALQELDARLRDQGSCLIVRYGDPREEIPRLAAELGADRVVAGRAYEPYDQERDHIVAGRLLLDGRELETVKDCVVIEPGEVYSQAGTPFRVYTPYSKAWRARFVPERDAAGHVPDLSRLVPAQALAAHQQPWDLEQMGFVPAETWIEPGEDAAQRCLREFEERMAAYAERRDIPSVDGTSVISPHLRFGTVSIRAAVRAALARPTKGADKWLAELIWREFYQDVLFHHPWAADRPIQPQFADLQYPGTPGGLEAWKEGLTGYPIVDAAMRAFRSTGWMHNRLRMIVASFLTKDLLIDYREGEAHFARYLLDFELASNNGGWQWAASVGCDAQPYFRIFNPVLQGLKFDPEGAFVHAWVPELQGLTGEALHAPWDHPFELAAAGIELGRDYPHPIVDHRTQKELAVRLLEAAQKGKAASG